MPRGVGMGRYTAGSLRARCGVISDLLGEKKKKNTRKKRLLVVRAGAIYSEPRVCAVNNLT